MWCLLLLSTASVLGVDGRPQFPDLSKLPPSEGFENPARELVARGSDGASLSEEGVVPEAIVAATDSVSTETTESYGESTGPAQTLQEGEGLPIGGPSGSTAEGAPESYDVVKSSARGEAYDGAASSEGSPEGGLVEEEEKRADAVAVEEGSTFAPSVSPEPIAIETKAPELVAVHTDEPEQAAIETEKTELVAAETEKREPVPVETETPETLVIKAEKPEQVEVVTETSVSVPVGTETPEHLLVETEKPETVLVQTEAPEQVTVKTEVLEPVVVVESEAPKPVAVETEAPEPASVETEEPKENVKTETTQVVRTTVPAPPAPESAAEVSQTEGPASESRPAPEKAITIVTAKPVEESVTEVVPTEHLATEAAATTPGRSEAKADEMTEESRPGELEKKQELEEASAGPEQEEGPVSSDDSEQEAAAAEMLDGAVQEAPGTGDVGDEKAGKLSVAASPPADALPEPADGDASVDDTGAPAHLVELDDVYNRGMTSQLGQGAALMTPVQKSINDAFRSRHVDYRLGKHRVSTYVTDLTVEGFNDIRTLYVSSDIDEMSLNVTLQFPKITFTGRFNATGSILNKSRAGVLVLRTPFPSYGHGNITVVVTNTTAVTRAELSHSFNDRKLSIELQDSHVIFGEPQVTLTVHRLPWALKKLQFERLFTVAVGKMISLQLVTEVEPKVEESLYDVITSVLGHVSLDEISANSFSRLEANPEASKTA